jgi:hypothetical protein
MRTVLRLIATSCLLCGSIADAQQTAPKKAEIKPAERPFLVAPYLQLGDRAEASAIELMWHAEDADGAWTVEYQTAANQGWKGAGAVASKRVAPVGSPPHRVYRARLTGLESGEAFKYRVAKDGESVFTSEGRAIKRVDQPQRFVVFGDCGANTPEQRAVTHQTFLARPDYVMITGDIVYSKGLASEYREKYWPIFNSAEASPTEGAPLLRSTLFVAAPGNHDIATRDLGKFPDALAYFYYWAQPLNGPDASEGDSLVAPLVGPEANKKAFYDAAGPAFPRMATFSFDYGNAHWTVIDANGTVDWTNPALQKWVSDDLASAKGAKWRFVSFHQPGFSSSKSHFDEQSTRIMSPIFEAGKVDVVFTGHVHNYQRTYPLTFVPDLSVVHFAPDKTGKQVRTRRMAGKWTLDKSYNSTSDTSPEGVIYLVTGAGGQRLYNPEQQDAPETWQEFTQKFISKVHSFTVADIDASTLTVRQVSPTGQEVDRFVIKK